MVSIRIVLTLKTTRGVYFSSPKHEVKGLMGLEFFSTLFSYLEPRGLFRTHFPGVSSKNWFYVLLIMLITLPLLHNK